MKARITISPRFTGGTEDIAFLPPEDIECQLASGGLRIVQKPERNVWSYGIISVGDVRLNILDRAGRYGPASEAGSIFAYYGLDGAKVNVYYHPVKNDPLLGEIVVWRGRTTSKNSKNHVSDGRSSLLVRTIESIILDETIGGGIIVNGIDQTEIVRRIFNDSNIINNLPGVPLIDFGESGTYILKNALDLIGNDRQAAAVLRHILQVTDSLLSYDYHRQRPIVFARGAINHLDYPRQDLTGTIVVTEVEDGGEQVYNQFVMQTGLQTDDEEDTNEDTLVVESAGSILDHGLRAVTINAKWLRSRDNCFAIGQYLLRRLARPRQAITVEIDAWTIRPEYVLIGQGLNVRIEPIVDGGTPRWGNFRWGTGTPRQSEHRGFYGNYWIEEIHRDIVQDTIKLKLREEI